MDPTARNLGNYLHAAVIRFPQPKQGEVCTRLADQGFAGVLDAYRPLCDSWSAPLDSWVQAIDQTAAEYGVPVGSTMDAFPRIRGEAGQPQDHSP